MGALEIALSIAGAMIVTAPYAIWHYGMVGLRFGAVGLAVLALATLWEMAHGPAGLAMLVTLLGAFSYLGVFALIAHAADQLHYRGSAQ